MISTTVTPVTATEPGALDGFEVRCTCGDISAWSLLGIAEQHAQDHEAWHAKTGR